MTKAEQTEKADAIEKLRGWIKPGDTVYTILDSVSRSGMSRVIRVVLLQTDTTMVQGQCIGKTTDLHPNYAVGRALGLRHAKRDGREQDGLVVGGCGMDMGYHVVYNLARVLFADGFACIGEGCPSNDHTNERVRDYTVGRLHSDPGYALRHRWL